MNSEQYESNRTLLTRSREVLTQAHHRGEHHEYVARCAGCSDRAEIEQFDGIKRGALVRLFARPWLALPLISTVALLGCLVAWLAG